MWEMMMAQDREFGTSIGRLGQGDPRRARLTALSQQKWTWMAERNVEALADLFHDNAIFVHMGAVMTKPQELGVIGSGAIEYKQVDIDEASARFLGATALVTSQITLHAIVGGHVADNPFYVTETYIEQDGGWKLGALVFTKRWVPE
jgi:hypothetical protein